MKCDQCNALMINRVYCHETGCPNQGKRFDLEREIWVNVRECKECGCIVVYDNPCCEYDEDEEDEDWLYWHLSPQV